MGPKIKDMKSNKNINIPIGVARQVFAKLKIDPKTMYLMDVKRAIFEHYKIPSPAILIRNPRKTLDQQKPNNAYGVPITDEEIEIFMKLFDLTDEDLFQECIGGRIVSEILAL